MTATAYGTAAIEVDPAGPGDRRKLRRRRGKGSAGRWLILLVCGIYFIGPLIAAISFTLQSPHGLTLSAYGQIFEKPPAGQIGFLTALVYSLEIAAGTILLTMALMLPTQLLLNLRLQRWRGLVEVITLLPLVVPPVVIVVGVSDIFTQIKSGPVYTFTTFIRGSGHPIILVLLYVMLAMPFVYRSLDAGIRAIDVLTLVEASRNLGAGWLTVLFRILVPCLRTAIINASFLCFALVMGEYTISSILLYNKPFPVWLAQLPTTSGHVQAAVSVFSLLLIEALLLLVSATNWRRSNAARS
ncbi:MAG: rane protein of unknown function [Pseudonocardiales bacterium]|nr:rane protein of unknown function [Pseudonocardiales bacterium]